MINNIKNDATIIKDYDFGSSSSSFIYLFNKIDKIKYFS